MSNEKNRYSECYLKTLHANPKLARHILKNLSPNPVRLKKLGPTYSELIYIRRFAFFVNADSRTYTGE